MREARASGAPWVSKSTNPRKFGNHVTVHRRNEGPSVRTTGTVFIYWMYKMKFSCYQESSVIHG